MVRRIKLLRLSQILLILLLLMRRETPLLLLPTLSNLPWCLRLKGMLLLPRQLGAGRSRSSSLLCSQNAHLFIRFVSLFTYVVSYDIIRPVSQTSPSSFITDAFVLFLLSLHACC